MARYETHDIDVDGWTDWLQPVENGYRMSCCDCGLVHELDFRISDDGTRAQFRARRHTRATAQKRVWRNRRAA